MKIGFLERIARWFQEFIVPSFAPIAVNYALHELGKIKDKKKLADIYHLTNNWWWPFKKYGWLYGMSKFKRGINYNGMGKFICPITQYLASKLTEKQIRGSQWDSMQPEHGAYMSGKDQRIKQWIKENE